MNKRILIIQGHPDAPGGKHLCHVLAQAYATGAQAAGHEVQVVDVATLDFPLLRSQQEWEEGGDGRLPAKLLTGRSARVVVTMGMPALIYRWYFRAHSVKALERNILGFVGIAPIRETLIGGVDGLGEAGVATWCGKLSKLGRRAH